MTKRTMLIFSFVLICTPTLVVTSEGFWTVIKLLQLQLSGRCSLQAWLLISKLRHFFSRIWRLKETHFQKQPLTPFSTPEKRWLSVLLFGIVMLHVGLRGSCNRWAVFLLRMLKQNMFLNMCQIVFLLSRGTKIGLKPKCFSLRVDVIIFLHSNCSDKDYNYNLRGIEP